MSTDYDTGRIDQLTQDYNSCSDNNQSDAANTIREEIRKSIEDNINDSRAPEYESSKDDSK
jgi:hypothetical protein